MICTSRRLGVVLGTLAILSAAPSVRAQDGSGLGSSAEKQAKLEHFDDSKASGRTEEAADEDDGRGLIMLPVVVVDPLLGLGLGAAGVYSFLLGDDPDARGSYISASALVTTNKQFRLALTHDIDVAEEHLVLRGRLQLKVFSEDYWGIGNDTPDEDQRNLSYSSIDYLGRINIATKYEYWFVGPLVRFLFTWNSRLEAPYPPPELAADQLNDFLMVGLGLSLVYDSRDGLTNPYSGWYFAVELINLPSGIPKIPPSTVGTIAGIFELRNYWKPWTHRDQVLATRLHGDFSYGRVPFSMLPSPGRDDKLRGHLDGRRRDYNLAGIDIEYRVRWWGPIGSTFFAGWSVLFGEKGDRITWETMPKSVGAGLRYMVQKADRLNLRLDFGYDFHGFTAVIFEAGEAF